MEKPIKKELGLCKCYFKEHWRDGYCGMGPDILERKEFIKCTFCKAKIDPNNLERDKLKYFEWGFDNLALYKFYKIELENKQSSILRQLEQVNQNLEILADIGASEEIKSLIKADLDMQIDTEQQKIKELEDEIVKKKRTIENLNK